MIFLPSIKVWPHVKVSPAQRQSSEKTLLKTSTQVRGQENIEEGGARLWRADTQVSSGRTNPAAANLTKI
jgi:hypothetical protein